MPLPSFGHVMGMPQGWSTDENTQATHPLLTVKTLPRCTWLDKHFHFTQTGPKWPLFWEIFSYRKSSPKCVSENIWVEKLTVSLNIARLFTYTVNGKHGNDGSCGQIPSVNCRGILRKFGMVSEVSTVLLDWSGEVIRKADNGLLSHWKYYANSEHCNENQNII